ncbi:WecB/TagA/CpsF family glycosyltransferase [Bythopirellula polymerisocia]|uniref:Putative N-acetylmannosaminyltransferase n=1 Tax=Bythopirellula polymerisocia TaxID=2528003 RepID=A0A5C6C835_9BACT|nr:WecB/TagA/CpsF family glycosyltransferase [Bythopirellula polymerisocia]TWU20823.1 putative N-acetylmannosaminyltransferase [Bythopirellula polymerisocia]
MNDRRINVLGVGISVLTLDTAIDAINEAIAAGRQGYVTVTGVHGISECQRDPELKRIHNASLLSTPDGMPLTWLGRLQGLGPAEMDRVYGPDLMLRIFAAGQKTADHPKGLKHYLMGGGEGVAEILRGKLLTRFPNAEIVGIQTPPFRPLTTEEEFEFVAELNRLRPDCLWVGLSTPKQERFMADLLSRYGAESTGPLKLPAPLVMFGVGAAFDFHAGLVPQAPRWIQRAGMEWGYRLAKEPRRLWRRYLTNNPLFLARIAMQLSGLKKYELHELPASKVQS